MAKVYLGGGNDDGVSVAATASQLAGMHGAAVTQAAAITLTSGTLGTVNTAVNSILTALRNKGIIAS